MTQGDLAGRTILVTRAAAQAQEFIRAIAARGGTPLVVPMIEIAPPLSWTECDSAIGRLGTFDGLVFASTNGVEGFFGRLPERGAKTADLAGRAVYAVGRRTKEAVERHGLSVRVVPERYTAADLVAALQSEDLSGKRLLFPRGNLGSTLLADGLAGRGATVETVEVYRTIEPEQSDVERMRAMLEAGRIDAATFASPSAARHFAALFPDGAAADLGRRTAIAAIGPSTAAALSELGLPPAITAAQSTMESLLDAIARFLQHSETSSRTRETQ